MTAAQRKSLAELQQTKRGRDLVDAIFRAGFAESGEGFNAEYGADYADVTEYLNLWLAKQVVGP